MKCCSLLVLLLAGVLACQHLQLSVLAASASAAQAILIHDPSRHSLSRSATPTPQQRAVTPAVATATLCAASGLVPPLVMDQEAAGHVQGLVQAGSALGAGPKALLLLHLAGVNPDSPSFSKVQAAWGEGSTVHLDLQPSSSRDDSSSSGVTAGSLLQAASDIVAANPDAKVTVLDHSALKDCAGGHCLQQHLHKAMHHCGGKLHTTTAPSSAGAHNNDQQKQQKASSAAPLLSGRLQLPGLQEEGVEGLDLQLPGVRLFALELAALQGSAQQLVARLEQQSVQELDQVQTVYESTFVGLQALAAHFPRGSPEYQAAESALMELLGSVVTSLKGVYGDDVLYQVTFLGDAPVSSSDPSHLMDWKEVSRRVLLRRSVEGDALRHLSSSTSSSDSPSSSFLFHRGVLASEASDSKAYAEKATAYAVTLLLIWFTFAGVYCMVSMPFKQDTLLYGRSKAD